MYPIYIGQSSTVPAWVLVIFAFASGVGITILFQVCR